MIKDAIIETLKRKNYKKCIHAKFLGQDDSIVFGHVNSLQGEKGSQMSLYII